MFDAIAPRYDLVNRIMTFRLDVRWRRRAVRALELAPGSRVLDLASGTGDLCIDLARAGHQPISVDLSFGMLVADRSGAPPRAGRHPAPPRARPLGRRCDVRVRAAQPRRAPGVLRRARTRGAARREDRPARRRNPTQPDRAVGQRDLLRQGRAPHRRAPVGCRGLPVPPPERRLPASARRRWSRRFAPPGSATRRTTSCRAGSPSS